MSPTTAELLLQCHLEDVRCSWKVYCLYEFWSSWQCHSDIPLTLNIALSPSFANELQALQQLSSWHHATSNNVIKNRLVLWTYTPSTWATYCAMQADATRLVINKTIKELQSYILIMYYRATPNHCCWASHIKSKHASTDYALVT